jgi:hypothetical protein
VTYNRSVARGIGDIEGWPAVAWVAGMGAGLLLTAGILWLRSRSFRDEPAELPSYRTAGAAGSHRASEVRALAIVLVVICMLSQLLYVALYIELAQWLLGARERPRITGDLFFWVFLVDVTCAGASLFTGWSRSE